MLNVELCAIVDNTPFDYCKDIHFPSSWERKKIRNHTWKKKFKNNYEPVKIFFIALKFTLALVLAASSSSL